MGRMSEMYQSDMSAEQNGGDPRIVATNKIVGETTAAGNSPKKREQQPNYYDTLLGLYGNDPRSAAGFNALAQLIGK